jgi:cyclopropane fatty-acyl-phospholipid synthase-like methyltransferase
LAYFDHFATGKSTRIGDWLTEHAIELQLDFLRRHLALERNPEILEIGPGQGEFAARIMAAGGRNYDVVEPNATLRTRLEAAGVRKAKSYFIPELQEADASYDAVIVCDVFEHLNDAREAQRFVAEAQRVLRPGGILFILSPDYMDWKEDFYNCDFSHSNPTTVRRTHEIFINEGLETAGHFYSYSGFRGIVGLAFNRLVKMATFWMSGEDLDTKLYKLRLTFLRRFMIVGRKPAAAAR